MGHLLRDARLGLRLLRRNPGFSGIAVLALALGIAANTAIFSVVHATLLAPMPYPNPDQLVMVWSRIQDNRNVTAAGTYLEWQRQSTSFQALNAWSGRSVSLSSGERPEQVPAAQVLRQVLLEGTLTALTGVLIGSIGAYLVGRAMQGMWFGVGVIDPTAFGVTAGLLVLSAVVACLVPAVRAASVDPMTALRQD